MNYELVNKRENHLSLLLQILKNRGVEDVEGYLHTSDDNILSPYLFYGMAEGVEMLYEKACQKADTFLLVDCDTDGYMSSSELYNYCHRIWPQWVDEHWKFYVHDEKQHGLSDCINKAMEYELILIPDAGSNDYDELKALSDAGKSVIILDHHLADERANYKNVIVINNQFGEYPNPTLSGAGVVYKFCQALDEKMERNWADNFLDLAAIGMIADMVDLRNLETHRLIEKGLNNVTNPLILEMMDKNAYRIKGHLNPKVVSWNIAPVINSVTRVGTIEEKQLLFKALLEDMAYTKIPSKKKGHKQGEEVALVEEAIRVSNNVRSRQNRIRDAKFKTLIEQIEKEELTKNKILVIRQEIANDDEKGITGLIANQIVAKYQQPTLLLRETLMNGEKTWSGSGRNVPHGEISNLNRFIKETQLSSLCEGHESAFGCAIADSNIEQFINVTNELLKDCTFSSNYRVDDVLTPSTINLDDLIAVCDQKDIWGQEIQEPSLVVKDIKLRKEDVLATEKRIQIMVNGLECVKFRPTGDEYMLFSALKPGKTLEVVGKLEYNEYTQAPQLLIEDYNLKEEELWYF